MRPRGQTGPRRRTGKRVPEERRERRRGARLHAAGNADGPLLVPPVGDRSIGFGAVEPHAGSAGRGGDADGAIVVPARLDGRDPALRCKQSRFGSLRRRVHRARQRLRLIISSAVASHPSLVCRVIRGLGVIRSRISLFWGASLPEPPAVRSLSANETSGDDSPPAACRKTGACARVPSPMKASHNANWQPGGWTRRASAARHAQVTKAGGRRRSGARTRVPEASERSDSLFCPAGRGCTQLERRCNPLPAVTAIGCLR